MEEGYVWAWDDVNDKELNAEMVALARKDGMDSGPIDRSDPY